MSGKFFLETDSGTLKIHYRPQSKSTGQMSAEQGSIPRKLIDGDLQPQDAEAITVPLKVTEYGVGYMLIRSPYTPYAIY